MKKILMMMLSFVTVLSLFSACGEKNTPTSTPGETTALQETGRTYLDSLPATQDLNYDLSIIAQSNTNYHYDVLTDSQSKDYINQWVFRRNSIVEERFNVTINTFADTPANVYLKIHNAQMGSDSGFDLAFEATRLSTKLMAEGAYIPCNTVSAIDLQKEYWDSDVIDAFNFDGNVYLVNGSISPTSLMRTSLIAFNKELFDAEGISYPYDTVRSGAWTLDELATLTANFTKDKNGDGEIRLEDDFFGMSCWCLDVAHSLFYGAGGMLVKSTSDGERYLDLNVENNDSIMTKIRTVLLDNQAALIQYKDLDKQDYIWQIFETGRGMFLDTSMIHLSNQRFGHMSGIGILPVPKYDTNQQYYFSNVSVASSMVGILTSSKNTEAVGMILEAMASTAHQTVTPNITQIICKTQNVSDPDSSEMFDYVIAHRVFDLAYVDDTLGKGVGRFCEELINPESTESVSSYFGKYQESAVEWLDKIVAQYGGKTAE